MPDEVTGTSLLTISALILLMRPREIVDSD